jgi:hypothetical protein
VLLLTLLLAAPPEYHQTFETADALKEFAFTDAAAWRHAPGQPAALELHKQSKYTPPHRSPANIALLKGKKFGDVTLACDALQTGKEYGHRDMVFVFGYQNPAQYYYVHIATKGDDNANQVFIVNNAPRKKISATANAGNDWGLNKWHAVRIDRTLADGSIKVFFDDMQKPIMTATDTTFGPGWIGVGSFDDTGKIANLKLSGTAETATAPEFKK